MTIQLAGIELRGFHGVLEHERQEGQRFLVDLELDLADTTAAETDRIEDAVDYRDVVATVVEVSDARAYHLLVKEVKRCGRGFENFEHYRLRVLLRAGKPTWPNRPTPPILRTPRPHAHA